GLGLSIARGIVEAHGGEIRLSSTAAGGAEFGIILPAEVSYLKNLKNE
ncbi:MAG: sensor histidine kinase, partial [Leadbetterella sp.]|nr:sensor histidine kinase [Leadbetterella sp.]